MKKMERPERYDPEDLEHLMLERGFDELLEEERAYALRHLEGRAEYERMRALLHHVREDKRDHAPMDADPAVRERVLAAFRMQQQPQWRIWLNSVGGFLLPARPSMYWRPALALGTVAVLIFASLMIWNAMEPKENKVLAEVRQETPACRPAKTAVQEDQLRPATPPLEDEHAPESSAITSTLSFDKQAENIDMREEQTSAGATAKQARAAAPISAPVADAPSEMADEAATTGYAERLENMNKVAANEDRLRATKATGTSARPDSPAEVAEDAGVTGSYDALASEKHKRTRPGRAIPRMTCWACCGRLGRNSVAAP
ncbi:MAG: hypothetical protein IPO60_02475 [Flavobacteriales bacterium]|nr:hypothetical protein [Flavobacteriales bacterium]